MILVDHREKNSLIVSDLIEKVQELRMEQLEVGDYIIGDIVI